VTKTPERGPSPTTGREAAFFDLDKTIIAKAAMAALRGPLYEGGLLNRRSLARALFAQLVYLHLGANEHRLDKVREAVLRLTKGWDREVVRAIVDEALAQIVEPIIYAEALDLIEHHRAQGHLVVIVSASPAEIVSPLARHLGVEATIASEAEVDEQGRYTGRMAFYAYGPYKADAMRALAAAEGVDLSRSFAYSDSYTDLPMLEAVGHPVAVNPDRILARLARERSWQVCTFANPVRVRDRMRVAVPQRRVAYGLVVAVAGSLAVALGRWLNGRGLGDGAPKLEERCVP